MKRQFHPLYIAGLALILGLLLGCSGGSTSDISKSTTPQVTTGLVDVIISDDSTEDWATIGVKVLSISLTPQGGGSPVVVYTASSPVPVINLVQLDQLGELIGNAQIPAGTYTGATITISANPGDVMLTAAADPEAGFAGTAATTVPSSQIQIQGTTGTAGSLTTTVSVNLVSPLVVTAGQSNQLDLEFDLSHPALIVDHTPAGAGSTFWAINFRGPLRHHPIANIASFLLRDIHGMVTAVAANNTSITITRVFAVRPATNPETATAGALSRTILADAVNGTIFYDVDAKSRSVIKDFSSVAGSLTGKYVRIAARYQVDGSLVAVRVWASTTFNSLWVSPEGHVLHVNKTTNVITVENEAGVGVPVTVDNNTQFFFRAPSSGTADSTPIATGTSFVANGFIVRGFKVHVSVVDPLAVPLVAQSVDIEVARYGGTISSANSTSFMYTRKFNTLIDNYTFTDAYASTFKWWYFTFPTQATTGATTFVATVGGAVNFGGTVGTLPVWGTSGNTWGDSANPTGWAAVSTILQPTPVPRGTVSTAWAANSNGGTIAMTVPGGANAATVSLSNVSGSATLVYQVDRTGNVITVSPVDLTTTAGQATVASNLVVGTEIKASGVPQSDGSIKAYVLFYYTGTMPN
ncbi:MAG: DUF4382 domain-containing protein [Terriglobales bacterium]|jgi:hypothetical protein